jgi:hypothetical protein
MAIKTSGPLNTQDIANEFTGTKPHSLSEYARGGGLVPNKNQNSAIGQQGEPIAMSQFYGATRIINLAFEAYGGGGAGGSGFENNSDIVSRAGSGGPSGIMLMSIFDAAVAANGGVVPSQIDRANFLTAFNVTRDDVAQTDTKAGAQSGLGGNNNAFTSANATAGEASPFGAGGTAAPRNSAGGSAPWGHWGAGGGGGGGDQGNGDNYDFFGLINRGGSDEWGKAGEGGFYGGRWNGTVDVDVEVDYVVQLGKGGTPAFAVGNHDGGYGNPGYLKFDLDTGAATQIFTPPATGGNTERNQSYYFGFRIEKNGSVTKFSVPTDQPVAANSINTLWRFNATNTTTTGPFCRFGFQLRSDGTTDKIIENLSNVGGSNVPALGDVIDWLQDDIGTGNGDRYEVRLNYSNVVQNIPLAVNSPQTPTLSTGPQGSIIISNPLWNTWIPLDTNVAVTWGNPDPSNAGSAGIAYYGVDVSADISVEIRRIGYPTTDVTQTITLVLANGTGGN